MMGAVKSEKERMKKKRGRLHLCVGVFGAARALYSTLLDAIAEHVRASRL